MDIRKYGTMLMAHSWVNFRRLLSEKLDYPPGNLRFLQFTID